MCGALALVLVAAGATAERAQGIIQPGQKLAQDEENSEGPNFGYAVALSADGNTALIGAPDSDAGGSAWVFTRSANGWSQQGPELSVYYPKPGSVIYRFGASVALSADGNIALIGDPSAPGPHEHDGAAWVFTRVDGVWTRGPRLIDEEDDEHASFGSSVALSVDGDTALIGGDGDQGGTGAAWVFIRSGASWAQQAKLVDTQAWFPGGGAGLSVALSADGTTALIGSREDFGAWMFTRSGSTWAESAAFGGGLAHSVCRFGYGSSVALSGDGDTVLLAEPRCPSEELFFGAASVFTRVGSTWTSTELTSMGTGTTMFGSSVALSGDGDTALIGAGQNGADRGTAWVFRRVGASWTEQTPPLTGGTEENGNAQFGASVALSGDGDYALVGGPNDTQLMGAPGEMGAAWAFASASPGTVTSGAASVGTGTATLNGEVDPRGHATTAHFQYGTTTEYGQSTPVQEAGSAEGASPLAAEVTGLAPKTTYHFRVLAESSAGISYGADQTFTTAPVLPVILPPVAPVSRAAPTISGTPILGRALSVSQGTWVNGPTSFAYQWQRCEATGAGCANVSGAVGPTITLTQGDVGLTLRAIVTAANAGGSGSAVSGDSPVVGSLVESIMTWRFGWSSRYTVVESLVVKGLPDEGSVEVTCHGRGCPLARARAARAAARPRCRGHRCRTAHRAPPSEVSLTRPFKGRHLAVGARIEVMIVRAGWVGKAYIFTMRANRAPHLQIACLAPGSTQPGVGC